MRNLIERFFTETKLSKVIFWSLFLLMVGYVIFQVIMSDKI